MLTTMDEKISLEAIALYGDAYAEKVLKGFFASKDNINGQEILSLCSVQQVNLFVVRELFKAWKEDTRKLKSPYFDFENPEVKEALDAFMNIASQHILISKAHFSPLLKKAVSQTLLVCIFKNSTCINYQAQFYLLFKLSTFAILFYSSGSTAAHYAA